MYKKYLKESSFSFDQEKTLIENFGFFLYEYEFKFCKTDLGNLTDDDGKLIFYGPLYCYYIYNKKICINFMHLIQRQEIYIYITDTKSNNQSYIRKGYKLGEQYCYNFSLLAAVIKNDITQNNRIFGKSIK